MAIVLAGVLGVGSACSTTTTPSPFPTPSPGATAEEQVLFGAQRDLTQHRPKDAIAALDPLIDRYVAAHKGSDTEVYCSRSMSETFYYMVLAQSRNRDAVALDPTWAEAYYLKGYALIELKRIEDARASLEKARALSPQNSSYLSELAHTWHAEREWERSLALFQEAEEAARYSPDGLKTQERTRALRGQGFSLIELGRLDEAEEKFKSSLAADPHDLKAKNELRYIEQLRRQEN